MTDSSKKAIIAAFAANLGIAVAKLVGFLNTRSAGMLAECSALTFADLSAAIDLTEANIRGVVPAARVIDIEPDVRRYGSGELPATDAHS